MSTEEKVGKGCAYLVILFWLMWIALIVWGLFELVMLIKRS